MIPKFEQLRDVAGPVSRETLRRMEDFEHLFVEWAGRMNLVSASTLQHVWNRHILDSAQLLPLAPESDRWLDLGSGGGFPGLVLACLISERQTASIDLVESNLKKAGFLRAAIGALSLPARVHAKRVNDLHEHLAMPEVVTARALASLADLFEMAEPWLSGGAAGLLHKGRDYRREIEETDNSWTFDLIEHPSRISSDGVILEVRNLRRLVDEV